MHLTTATVLLSLAASALSFPVLPSPLHKRANILKVQDYADFQVSDGVAGNALAEVRANFPINRNNLAAVSADDLAILKAARETAEAAETDAGGFNEAIEAAGGVESTAGAVLQIGKIKNKVLKLDLEVLVLQIEAAQGEANPEKIAEEQKKLDTNIGLDKDEAGKKSQSVNFQGNSAP